MKSTLEYGSWPSPISAQSLVQGVAGLSDLQASAGCIHWLESRPEEAGRTVLVSLVNDTCRELTPHPYNVRSRVHEYGGGAYALGDDTVYFVNFSDQNLYIINSTGEIRQLTHSNTDVRFADFVLDRRRHRLITVVEKHRPDHEPENFLAALDLHSGALTILEKQHDFYAAPRLSPTGDRLAFIAWDHPNMPWDGTLLKVSRFDDDGLLQETANVAGGSAESVLQPTWQSDSALLFISDANGYWNLFRFDDSGIYCVLEDGADYAEPPWVLGSRSYALLDEQHAISTRQSADGQELVVINTETTMATPIPEDDASSRYYDSLSVNGGALYFIGSFVNRSPSIERLDLKSHSSECLRDSGASNLDPAGVAEAESIAFPSRDGQLAHGFFYPPTSATHVGPPEATPPLVVMSHGGPTAATRSTLSLKVQYYTSRGWAVLDVNYRGSSGYGREYRTALNGRWGELDVTDCEDGVGFLARSFRIDPDRVAIRGGSAGGFTTLAALTTSLCFKAGASHYGIGDLTALARDTHKFESRYLEGLLGKPEVLLARSPIQHLDRFRCPAIFFQGSEDKVVPPNQSQSMASALREKGIPVAYLEFPGEGHGFRQADNIVRAMESEYGFFCRVFGITPAERLPDIDIDNADNL